MQSLTAMRVRTLVLGAALCLLTRVAPLAAQARTRSDSDPTAPIFFSVRPEYSSVAPGVSRLVLIARYDAAVLAERRWLPGRRALLLRFEVPIAGSDDAGPASASGGGDAYAQALSVLWRSGRVAVVGGTGFSAPTATDALLGSGKWVVAPSVAPIWFIAGGGMAYVKVQDFASVAGDRARPDFHYLLITPTVIRPVGRSFWVLLDSETKTDWLLDGRTGVKSGAQFGAIVARGVGMWVKPEVWWGPNRSGRWNLKGGVIWYR